MPVLGQIGLDLLPGHVEEGSYDPPAHGRNPCQTARARAPDEVEQHGLQIIVRCVGGRDARSAHLVRRPVKSGVAQAARRRLDALPRLAGSLSDVRPTDGQGKPQTVAQRPHERLVPIGLRAAQTVIQMEGVHLVPERAQGAHERDRIGAARQTDEHPPAGRKHGLPGDGLPYGI